MLISSVMFNPRTSQSISVSEISPFFLPAIQFIQQPDEEKLQFRAETELHRIIISQMLTSDSLWIAGFIGYQVTGKSAYCDI